jgi:hypothetical protein
MAGVPGSALYPIAWHMSRPCGALRASLAVALWASIKNGAVMASTLAFASATPRGMHATALVWLGLYQRDDAAAG